MISLSTALPGNGRASLAGADNKVMAGADARAGEGGFAGVAKRLRNGLEAGSSAVAAEKAVRPDGEQAAARLEPKATPITDAEATATAEPLPEGELEHDFTLNAAMADAVAGEADTDTRDDTAPEVDTGAHADSEAAAQAWAALTLPARSEAQTKASNSQTGVEAPVQLWRLREQAQVHAQAKGAASQHSLPDTAARQTPRLPEPNALLLQRLGGAEPVPPRPVTTATPATTGDAPPLFASALAALRSAPTGSHEWAPVQLQPGDKAVLGEQLLQTLKDKVELQLNQRVQQARIKLDPPEMGRMELTVRLEGDRLHVQINASHSGLRDAITAQADRLRHDLLSQHGGGVEVHVGQDGRQDSAPSFNEDIQIGAASADPGDDTGSAPMGLGWVNALA